MMQLFFESLRDIDRLLAWRMEVIESVFGLSAKTDTETLTQLCRANRDYYRFNIRHASHYACIALTAEGEEIGCGGLCFHHELPSPDNPNGKCAYMMNIYVRPDHRHQGAGHAIVDHLLEKCKRRGISKIYLEATPLGRELYSNLGFTDMANMMIFNPHNNTQK